ncbi:MAG: 50S ribosomal protein L14 [Mycoplasmataceae bacterium]|jgi:large subunit ribosomal protein L14|nr:50S ribosomal protein L14 [Mycoplasmataceae bacterium]
MVQVQTMLNVADNSGAHRVQVIKILGNSQPHYAHIGDVVKVAIKESNPTSTSKKGTMSFAVIVRTVKGVQRPNGFKLCFDDNACVLLKEDKETMRGTRIFGSIAREIKEKGFNKIASLAPEVI